MPCEIRAGQTRHSGLVLDISPSGLFIQTSARTRPGEPLALTLSLPNGEEAELQVEVARKKVVPARLLTLAQGGIGVRIASAPESYYACIRELGLDGAAPAPERAAGGSGDSRPEPRAAQRFRVRVSQVSGPRSRRMEVEAPDAEAARDAALEAVGEGWKILDVEPV